MGGERLQIFIASLKRFAAKVLAEQRVARGRVSDESSNTESLVSSPREHMGLSPDENLRANNYFDLAPACEAVAAVAAHIPTATLTRTAAVVSSPIPTPPGSLPPPEIRLHNLRASMILHQLGVATIRAQRRLSRGRDEEDDEAIAYDLLQEQSHQELLIRLLEQLRVLEEEIPHNRSRFRQQQRMQRRLCTRINREQQRDRQQRSEERRTKKFSNLWLYLRNRRNDTWAISGEKGEIAIINNALRLQEEWDMRDYYLDGKLDLHIGADSSISEATCFEQFETVSEGGFIIRDSSGHCRLCRQSSASSDGVRCSEDGRTQSREGSLSSSEREELDREQQQYFMDVSDEIRLLEKVLRLGQYGYRDPDERSRGRRYVRRQQRLRRELMLQRNIWRHKRARHYHRADHTHRLPASRIPQGYYVTNRRGHPEHFWFREQKQRALAAKQAYDQQRPYPWWQQQLRQQQYLADYYRRWCNPAHRGCLSRRGSYVRGVLSSDFYYQGRICSKEPEQPEKQEQPPTRKKKKKKRKRTRPPEQRAPPILQGSFPIGLRYPGNVRRFITISNTIHNTNTIRGPQNCVAGNHISPWVCLPISCVEEEGEEAEPKDPLQQKTHKDKKTRLLYWRWKPRNSSLRQEVTRKHTRSAQPNKSRGGPLVILAHHCSLPESQFHKDNKEKGEEEYRGQWREEGTGQVDRCIETSKQKQQHNNIEHECHQEVCTQRHNNIQNAWYQAIYPPDTEESCMIHHLNHTEHLEETACELCGRKEKILPSVLVLAHTYTPWSGDIPTQGSMNFPGVSPISRPLLSYNRRLAAWQQIAASDEDWVPTSETSGEAQQRDQINRGRGLTYVRHDVDTSSCNSNTSPATYMWTPSYRAYEAAAISQALCRASCSSSFMSSSSSSSSSALNVATLRERLSAAAAHEEMSEPSWQGICPDCGCRQQQDELQQLEENEEDFWHNKVDEFQEGEDIHWGVPDDEEKEKEDVSGECVMKGGQATHLLQGRQQRQQVLNSKYKQFQEEKNFVGLESHDLCGGSDSNSGAREDKKQVQKWQTSGAEYVFSAKGEVQQQSVPLIAPYMQRGISLELEEQQQGGPHAALSGPTYAAVENHEGDNALAALNELGIPKAPPLPGPLYHTPPLRRGPPEGHVQSHGRRFSSMHEPRRIVCVSEQLQEEEREAKEQLGERGFGGFTCQRHPLSDKEVYASKELAAKHQHKQKSHSQQRQGQGVSMHSTYERASDKQQGRQYGGTGKPYRRKWSLQWGTKEQARNEQHRKMWWRGSTKKPQQLCSRCSNQETVGIRRFSFPRYKEKKEARSASTGAEYTRRATSASSNRRKTSKSRSSGSRSNSSKERGKSRNSGNRSNSSKERDKSKSRGSRCNSSNERSKSRSSGSRSSRSKERGKRRNSGSRSNNSKERGFLNKNRSNTEGNGGFSSGEGSSTGVYKGRRSNMWGGSDYESEVEAGGDRWKYCCSGAEETEDIIEERAHCRVQEKESTRPECIPGTNGSSKKCSTCGPPFRTGSSIWRRRRAVTREGSRARAGAAARDEGEFNEMQGTKQWLLTDFIHRDNERECVMTMPEGFVRGKSNSSGKKGCEEDDIHVEGVAYCAAGASLSCATQTSTIDCSSERQLHIDDEREERPRGRGGKDVTTAASTCEQSRLARAPLGRKKGDESSRPEAQTNFALFEQMHDDAADERDERWVHTHLRVGDKTTDAILACPGCFTPVCYQCQRDMVALCFYTAVSVRNVVRDALQLGLVLQGSVDGDGGRGEGKQVSAIMIAGEQLEEGCHSSSFRFKSLDEAQKHMQPEDWMRLQQLLQEGETRREQRDLQECERESLHYTEDDDEEDMQEWGPQQTETMEVRTDGKSQQQERPQEKTKPRGAMLARLFLSQKKVRRQKRGPCRPSVFEEQSASTERKKEAQHEQQQLQQHGGPVSTSQQPRKQTGKQRCRSRSGRSQLQQKEREHSLQTREEEEERRRPQREDISIMNHVRKLISPSRRQSDETKNAASKEKRHSILRVIFLHNSKRGSSHDGTKRVVRSRRDSTRASSTTGREGRSVSPAQVRANFAGSPSNSGSSSSNNAWTPDVASLSSILQILREPDIADTIAANSPQSDLVLMHPVRCSTCYAALGVFEASSEMYYFLEVLPGEA